MPPPVSLSAKRIRRTRFIRAGLAIVAAATLLQHPAHAQRVRVTGLTDVNFGMLANLQSDSRQSQSMCVYSNGSTNSYSVSAWGSGAGGSFELSNGSSPLPYDVEWSDSSGQSSGISLTPNVPLTGQVSGANHQTCSNGPVTSASLTLVLRAVELAQAREGTYDGSLTLLISAE